MSKKNSQIVAEKISEVFGDNIESFTNCMTRLRIKTKNSENITKESITSIENVLGLVMNGNEFQIVLGPGFVNRVASDFEKITSAKKTDKVIANMSEEDKILNDDLASKELLKTKGIETKEKYRSKTKTAILDFFNKISKIFTPLIPAFLAAGILQAIGSIILTSVGQENLTATSNSWISFTTMLLTLLIQVLCVIIGWNTAKVFGGSPIIGALLASMYTPLFGTIVAGALVLGEDGTSANFLGIHISNIDKNWFTVGIFRDGKAAGLTGSMFGAIAAAAIASLLQLKLEKYIPDGAKLICVPLIVCVSMLVLQFLLIVPISGYVFKFMSLFFQTITTNKWLTPWLGAMLAAVWLWLVVFGVHQGATPIYLILISETGLNTLFPIVAMAGASQVGAALALYVKAKKGSVVRKQIAGSIVPGFLGIGEPLIYGVMLPRIRAFGTSCAGAAVGGLFVGLLPILGVSIGTTALGPSGLLALPLMSASNGIIWEGMLLYLAALAITYSAGFLFTFFFGTKGVDLT